MDFNAINTKGKQFFGKYRYVFLVLLLGIGLMLLPEGNRKKQENSVPVQVQQPQKDPAKELQNILTQVKGAGKVEVLLTEYKGKQVHYQTDTRSDHREEGSEDRKTVIITAPDRTQSGLIASVTAPEYRGAMIVCQGADSAEVRLHIVEAVSAVTGLPADRISVLKMK